MLLSFISPFLVLLLSLLAHWNSEGREREGEEYRERERRKARSIILSISMDTPYFHMKK
jgi:hypothetical protein